MRFRKNTQFFQLRRSWILGLSSLFWVIPAGLLLRRAMLWSYHLDQSDILVGAIIVALTAGASYRFWFSDIVRKNIRRIHTLPSRPEIWHVFSRRGYGMIMLMVALGIVLRSSEMPKIYLAGPYAWMGACLLLGSLQMALMFLKELRPKSVSDDPPS